MRLFYIEKTIHSPLSTEQVAKKLRGVTGQCIATLAKPFVGTVSKDSFELKPLTLGKNSMAPWLYGQITDMDKGSQIRVVAKPTARELLIMAIVMVACLCLYTFVDGLYTVFSGWATESDWVSTILSLPFGALMVSAMQLAFWIPAKNALCRLEQLVK